jgi:hypothetical protein
MNSRRLARTAYRMVARSKVAEAQSQKQVCYWMKFAPILFGVPKS